MRLFRDRFAAYLLLCTSSVAAAVVGMTLSVVILSLIDLDAYARVSTPINPHLPGLLRAMFVCEAAALLLLAATWRARGGGSRAWHAGRAATIAVAMALALFFGLVRVLPSPG